MNINSGQTKSQISLISNYCSNWWPFNLWISISFLYSLDVAREVIIKIKSECYDVKLRGRQMPQGRLMLDPRAENVEKYPTNVLGGGGGGGGHRMGTAGIDWCIKPSSLYDKINRTCTRQYCLIDVTFRTLPQTQKLEHTFINFGS